MSLFAAKQKKFNEDLAKQRLDDLLYRRLPRELGCALAASVLVSPMVSIIDKAIVVEITGIQSLVENMAQAGRQMMVTPGKFFGGLSFRLTMGVYFGTFAVANVAEALLDHQQFTTPREDSTRNLYKVSAASAANIGLLAWRDSVFAKTFAGSVVGTRRTPLRTLGLFAARDSATMAATFCAAPMYSEYLQQEHRWSRNKANVFSAVTVPVFAQFLTAPLHIHALDFFVRPAASSASRFEMVSRELAKVSFARGIRVLPAFGLGSFGNMTLRDYFVKDIPFETIRRRLTDAASPGQVMATSSKR